MEYLYHRVPPHMVGKILYPLNQLKDLYPEQYAEHVKKYEGREKLLIAEVPPLHCLWNDVLHLTAVPPDELRKNLLLAGIEYSQPFVFFKIPIKKIQGDNTIAFTYRRDKDLEPNFKDYEAFSEDRMEAYRTVPSETIEYYKEMKAQGKHPLLFHFVPHILFKGTIDIDGLEIITIPGTAAGDESAWKTYFEKTKNSKPRILLVNAMEFVKEKNNALDLGSGALNDVRYLVEQGFKHITAVDYKPIAKDIIQNFPPDIVKYVISSFEDFEYTENKYDLINAQYALPFNPKETFNSVWSKIIGSLKTDGVIAGQFFGERDEWNTKEGKMNFHTLEETKALLSDLNIVHFQEEEAEKTTAAGNMKHWHVFHFIAIKK